MLRFLMLLFFVSAPAVAQDKIVTPEEFEAMSTNKTLYFDSGNQFHGAEQYFPNRKVTWQFADGECDKGFWFSQGASICFSYETKPTPQCWLFVNNSRGFVAKQIGAPVGQDLVLDFVDTNELLCGNPFLGS